MAKVARTVLTIGGAFFFGAPGALIGGMIGNILFPPEDQHGPRLNEVNFQRSTVGAPIPIVYGTVALAGNVIWSGGLIESRQTDEVGGFLGFGGQEVHSYTYSVDVAVGICEGPIQGIRRIWADADLIYDVSDQTTLTERFGEDLSFEEFFAALGAMSAQLFANSEFYLGTEDQLADPTIESYEGVGQVPGFRGLAYVVFRGFKLADYGNRIPSFRFEVYTGLGTEEDCTQYSNDVLYPWDDGATLDPRNPDNRHVYAGVGAGDPYVDSLDGALAQLEAIEGRPFVEESLHGWFANGEGIAASGGAGLPPAPCSAISTDAVTVYMYFNSFTIAPNCTIGPGEGVDFCDDWPDIFGEEVAVYWNGDQGDGTLIPPGSGYWAKHPSDTPESAYFHGYSEASSNYDCGDGTQVSTLPDHLVAVKREPTPPDGCGAGIPIADAPGYCVLNGVITRAVTWTLTGGTWHVLREMLTAEVGGELAVTQYPLNPARPSTHAEYNDEAFWEAAYADAVAAGDMPPGLVYGVDYPDTQSHGYVGSCVQPTVEVECIPMAVIVADLCRRAGLEVV